MVNMIPDMISSEIKSQAEANLFYEFRNYDTKQRYIILHSLGISEHVNNVFGEVDFVVISTSGVLCIEVKGGDVSCKNGIWEFTNRFGKKEQKTEGPFQQVQGNMQSLRMYLLKRLGRTDPLVTCQYASCVIMPDCDFLYEGIEIIPEVLFDKGNYNGLDEVVELSFAYWMQNLQDQHGFVGTELNYEEMIRLANLLRGDFHFVPSMKDAIDATSKALYALTHEQYDVLEALSDNDRTLVCGMAGTGKTWLGMEQARRLYWEGKSVLYVCYNKNISEYVKYVFEKESVGVEVGTLHALMSLDEETNEYSNEYFEKILPERFLQKESIKKYDYLIVDEGQDLFRDLYISCLSNFVKGGLQNGCWLFFYDQNQNIYNEDNDFERCIKYLKECGAASYKLTINCRNTKQIADANTLMTGVNNIGRPKINGLKVQYKAYHSKEEEQSILNDTLNELKNNGISGEDLIILSRYSISNPHNCLCKKNISRNIGTLKLSGQIWRAKKNEVRFSTISAFKGLESKAVILIDVDGFTDQTIRLLNYVAVSRASSLLYILYDFEKENERQQMIVNSFMKL